MKVGLIEQTFVTPGEKVIFFLGGGVSKALHSPPHSDLGKVKQIEPVYTYTHTYTHTHTQIRNGRGKSAPTPGAQ